jgi:predicted DNA-binding transcriptional regulator YafY
MKKRPAVTKAKRAKTAAKKKPRPAADGARFAPAQRLLEVRALLSSPHGATLEEIQARVECSRHTAMRTVAALEAMGEALVEEREERRLRYRITGGKNDKVTKLSTAHVLSVAVAREAIAFLEGTSLKEAFDEVVEMLESSLAPKAFAELRHLQERVVLIEDAPWVKVDRTDVIDGLVTGIARGDRVTLRGTGTDGERVFDFDPYTLLFWRGGIYVAGYSHHHNAVRLFGLDRLDDGEWKRGESFDVPASWDARARYGGSFDLFDGPETTVRVEFSPKVARHVVRREWARNQRIEEHADGRVVLTVVARGTNLVTNWVLGFGEHAVVLEPASMRQDLARVTSRMAAAYAKTT